MGLSCCLTGAWRVAGASCAHSRGSPLPLSCSSTGQPWGCATIWPPCGAWLVPGSVAGARQCTVHYLRGAAAQYIAREEAFRQQCVLPAVWELYVGTRPWAGMRHVQVIAQKMRGLGSLDFPPGTPAQYEASRHWTVHSSLVRFVSTARPLMLPDYSAWVGCVCTPCRRLPAACWYVMDWCH